MSRMRYVNTHPGDAPHGRNRLLTGRFGSVFALWLALLGLIGAIGTSPAAADVAFPLGSPSFQSVGDEMVPYKGHLYFAADDGTHGRELWRTDGTAAGTQMVADLNPTGHTNPVRLTVAGGRLFFNPTGHLDGVYAYDGVNAPVKLTTTSSCAHLTWIMGSLGDRLLTIGYSPSCANPIHGKHEMFAVSPGATVGAPISGVVSADHNGSKSGFATMGGWAYYAGSNTQGTGLGNELYRTNGTTTELVKDVNPGGPSSSPLHLTAVGNQLFFTAVTPANNRELWRTDGTAAGTRMVHEHVPGAGMPVFKELVAHNGRLFYAVQEPQYGSELWSSDGATSALVRDIAPGAPGSGPTGLTSVGSKLFFRTNQGLWVTDGSADGTHMLVSPPNDGYGVSYPTAVGDRLYFRAGGQRGSVIWRSDGTAAGTRQVSAGAYDAAPGTGNAAPGAIGVLDHRVIFPSRFPGDPLRTTWQRLTVIDTSLPDPVPAPPTPAPPAQPAPPPAAAPPTAAPKPAVKKPKLSVKKKPKIATGKVRVGTKLRAKVPTFRQKGVKLRFQWLANGKKIKKATKRTFTITARQKGKRIAVRVTATKKGFRATVVTSKATKKVLKKAPRKAPRKAPVRR